MPVSSAVLALLGIRLEGEARVRIPGLVVYFFQGVDQARVDAPHLPIVVPDLDERHVFFDSADDRFLQIQKRAINHEGRAIAQPDPYCHLLPYRLGIRVKTRKHPNIVCHSEGNRAEEGRYDPRSTERLSKTGQDGRCGTRAWRTVQEAR